MVSGPFTQHGVVTTLRRTYERDVEDGLVRDHLHLVRRAVAEMAAKMPRHAVRDDLVSAGMIGLAQAARSFDAARGVPFHRYAATRIKGALLDELRSQDWASRPVRAKARQMNHAAESLTTRLGRMPTTRELAEAMGTDVAAVDGLISDVHRATLLNYDGIVPSGEGDAIFLVEEDNPELEMLERERNAYLVDAVRALPPRLQTVVIGYFFQDRSMQDIATELGVSESRVSQLRAEALDLLRDGLNSQLDPSDLPDEPPVGRVARRKAAYFAAIAASSTPADRVGSAPRPAAVGACA
ncbi:MAG: sigma-70 family RNA polymerase sigma factor [Actinobacteria bacterium]|nr:sigma-70 family RNA polymerase sigma factor [Actinomycetota bacterium]